MKLNVDQLTNYIKQQNTLPSAVLLAGDEPLQIMEAADLLRNWAKSHDFIEREIYQADAQFDWSYLRGASNSLSLFSEKTQIDINVVTKTPGKTGSQVLREVLSHPPHDKFMLIKTPKLTGNARNSAWVKAIDKVGLVINIWELSTPQTMAWVAKRLRENGMQPSPDAVRLLTERVEGNLLAATQEISKLKLLFCDQPHKTVEINAEQVLQAVSDSSRYSIFDLNNAVMLGDAHRIQHIHHTLKAEGVPIPLVLWTLTDLSRQLYEASFNLNQGMSMAKIVAKMPRPRQKPFQVALQRMQRADWANIMMLTSKLDRLAKGQSELANKGMSRIWSDLLELALILAKHPVIQPETI